MFSTPSSRAPSQIKIKSNGHANIQHTPKVLTKLSSISKDFICILMARHFQNMPEILRERTTTSEMLSTAYSSYCLSTHADQDRKAKIKTIWNAITSDTFIISHNYSISHSLTYRKTWGTEPKRLKTLRTAYFLKFDHSSLPISILKEN